MVDLRVLSTEDWPLWERARVAALTEAPHAFKARLSDWDNGGREQWRARLSLPGACNVVAMRGESPAGLVRGLPGDGGTGELRSLWVAPGARGQGVGDRLVETVAAWALRSGRTTLKLAVIPGNLAAVALYERHGFVTTGEPGDPLPGGAAREQVMARNLR